MVPFTFLFIVLAACVQTEDLQDSGSYTPEILGHYVRVEDGTKLPIKSWLPNGQIKAIILSLHGFNDYSSFFSVPGSILATDYGIASYAYDQRVWANEECRNMGGHKDHVDADQSFLQNNVTSHSNIFTR